MHARHLRPLLQGAVAAAIPLAAASAVTPMLPGCCPPIVRREIRPIAELPTGWTRLAGYLDDGDGGYYYGGTDDPGIDKEACDTLCGAPAEECEIVLRCMPPWGV